MAGAGEAQTHKRTLTLPVIHVVDRVPIHFPREMDSDQAENQPPEENLEYGDPHVVGQPVLRKFRHK